MVVGVLQIKLRLPEAHSLKEKRWLVKSFLTRARNKFNVSISEIDAQDSWQRSTVAVAHVGNNRRFTNELLDQVLSFAGGLRQIEVVDSQLELL